MILKENTYDLYLSPVAVIIVKLTGSWLTGSDGR